MIRLLSILLLLWTPWGAEEEIRSSATRGITGQVRVLSASGLLRGRPDLDLESPLLVRLADYERLEDGRFACDLEFIGTEVGIFDLREVLVFENGTDIATIPPVSIEVVSNLAVDAPTDLVLAAPAVHKRVQ